MNTYEKLTNMVNRAWDNYLTTMFEERDMWAAIYLLLADERDFYLKQGV